MNAPPVLPRYLDAMLAAWRSGRSARAVHFGLWEAPPGPQDLQAPDAFPRAQARLDALMLGLAAVSPGDRVLDVGCGLGATLEALDRSLSPLALTGLNIDARQLDACRTLRPAPGNTLAWVLADACALPFAPARFERVLCVEAVFHFASRRRFFREAARVLAPGGSLVLTDLRAWPRAGPGEAGDDGDAPLEREVLAAFGPWPEFWVDASAAPPHEGSGLVLAQRLDISRPTLPTHAFTAPPGAPASDPLARACRALAHLHRQDRLQVVAERYVRP